MSNYAARTMLVDMAGYWIELAERAEQEQADRAEPAIPGRGGED
jgi:hypothetical protein